MSAGPNGNFLQLPIGKKSDPAAVGDTKTEVGPFPSRPVVGRSPARRNAARSQDRLQALSRETPWRVHPGTGRTEAQRPLCSEVRKKLLSPEDRPRTERARRPTASIMASSEKRQGDHQYERQHPGGTFTPRIVPECGRRSGIGIFRDPLQVGFYVPCRLPAIVRILRQALLHPSFQRGRRQRLQLADRRRFAVKIAAIKLARLFPLNAGLPVAIS